MTLLNILENDCRQWAGQGENTLLRNERDMQVRLTMYLEKTQHYDKVYTEYVVPLKMLGEQKFEVPTRENNKWQRTDNFPWCSQMRIDLVVEKDRKFAAVELKYSTVKIKAKEPIFGEKNTNRMLSRTKGLKI